PDLTKLSSETPLQIRQLVERCLRKDPRRRLQNIGDARIEIEDARAGTRTVDAPPQRIGVSRPIAWSLALAAVAAILVGIAFVGLGRKPSAAEMRLEITTPPTITPFSLAISPDGHKIVFSATVDRQNRLWLRQLDSASARQLPGTDNAV